jgi:hypothetical protein
MGSKTSASDREKVNVRKVTHYRCADHENTNFNRKEAGQPRHGSQRVQGHHRTSICM